MSAVGFSASSLKEGRWYEYLVRFALGGAATVFTGLISNWYGASIGGLFLALPAIFCASATLIEKHEITRKREAGMDGRRRGEEAAALDAAGAVLGSLGMLAFAIIFSLTVKRSVAAAFICASFGWLIVSTAGWCVRQKNEISTKNRRLRAGAGNDCCGRECWQYAPGPHPNHRQRGTRSRHRAIIDVMQGK